MSAILYFIKVKGPTMIELKQCCRVPFPEKLYEQYETEEKAIRANVSASKVTDMMKRFIEEHNEPLFFILEIPASQKDEQEMPHGTVRSLHCNVYYMNGLDQDHALQMLKAVGHFLVKDGLNTFGFAGHKSKEEILFGKYNVLTIYTADAKSYEPFLTDFRIKKTDKLVTAWDTFDKSHPGQCTSYESDGKTIFDIPDYFKNFGMYFAERRDENGQPYENKVAADDIIGKIMLVGITYYTAKNEFIEQKQFWGTVVEANKDTILIKQKNGTLLSLPPDLSSTLRAAPGEYRLHSTGEVIVDPDYLITWNCVKDDGE